MFYIMCMYNKDKNKNTFLKKYNFPSLLSYLFVYPSESQFAQL